MKKKNIAKVLLPLMLLGSPAFATASRNSSRRVKKWVSVSNAETTQKSELNQDPFALFGITSKKVVKKEAETQNLLSFLEEEGLLETTTLQKSSISGEEKSNSENRKNFANISCVNGATYSNLAMTYLNTSHGTYTAYISASDNGRQISDPTKKANAKDACQNGNADTTPPTWESSTPSQNSVTHNQVVINVDINEGGKAYAVVVANGASAPSSAQVKAGKDASNGAIPNNNVTLSSGGFNGTITITGLNASTAYDVYVVAEDDEGTPNVQASPTKVDITTTAAPADSDATITAGSGVDESSMIVLPSTATTTGAKVPLFDFKITDGATSDSFTTDVTQIVINVSGTTTDTVRGKIKWLLNGPDATDVEGTYSGGTITFSSLGISVANGGNETYTLSAYFNDPTALTDNATFTFSINGSSDVTVDPAKTQMQTGQSAITNSGNAKVDITATKLIFTTQPSN